MANIPTFLEGIVTCSTAFEWVKCVGFLNQASSIAVFFGALGALSIPFVIWFATGRREKKRLTIELINNITTMSEVVDRQERLYRYRIFEEYTKMSFQEYIKMSKEEKAEKYKQNPYKNNLDGLLFDSAIFLNFLEAACYEIAKRAVYRKPLYDTADAVILGAKKIVLSRYVRLTGINAERHYPYLLKIARKIEKRSKRDPPQTQIPGLQISDAEPPQEKG